MIGVDILCYGDSNTYGYDPRGYLGGRYPAEVRWVDLLGRRLCGEVRNEGENGREIPRRPGELERAELLLARSEAELVLVMLGTNDLLQGAPVSEVSARMETFLEAVRPQCGQLLLIAPPPLRLGAWVERMELVRASVQLAEEYRTLAERLRIPFADAGAWGVELAFDGVHFTEAGHRAFADGLYTWLKGYGTLGRELH